MLNVAADSRAKMAFHVLFACGIRLAGWQLDSTSVSRGWLALERPPQESLNMKRTIAITAIGSLMMAASAGAIGGIYRGVSAFWSACEAEGGLIAGNGSGTTCTVDVHGSTTDPSPPGFTTQWAQDAVYTWYDGASPVGENLGAKTATSCTNPGGEDVPLGNPNCPEP